NASDHRGLHFFPTRRSSDLPQFSRPLLESPCCHLRNLRMKNQGYDCLTNRFGKPTFHLSKLKALIPLAHILQNSSSIGRNTPMEISSELNAHMYLYYSLVKRLKETN